jgi:hypothetical protein
MRPWCEQPEEQDGRVFPLQNVVGLFNLVSVVQRFFFHTHRAGVKVKGV